MTAVLLDRINATEWEACLEDMHGRGITRGKALEQLVLEVRRREREEERRDVRCCCNPTKLYGTLPLPHDVREGTVVEFASYGGDTVRLTVAEWHRDVMHSLDEYLKYAGPVPAPLTKRREEGIALKMEEAGRTFEENLELLRRIPGFIERVPHAGH
jgi:hypothetical protein